MTAAERVDDEDAATYPRTPAAEGEPMSRTRFQQGLRGPAPRRPPRPRQIIVDRDAPDAVLSEIQTTVTAAYPRALVITRRPGLFGTGVVVAPWDEAIAREVERLSDAAADRLPPA